jgi:hypothetical protein
VHAERLASAGMRECKPLSQLISTRCHSWKRLRKQCEVIP